MPIMIPDRVTTQETVDYEPLSHTLHAALLQANESALGLEGLRQCRITRIECFQLGVEPFGREPDIRGFIALSTNAGIVGFKEFAVPRESLKGDLVMWVTPFQRMKGMNAMESFRFPQLKAETWGAVRVALIESALADILDKAGRRVADGNERRDLADREYLFYLFEHAQAYVAF